jgi:hypothetical protein
MTLRSIRSYIATAVLAFAFTLGGAITAQRAQAAYDEELPQPLPGPGACIEKQVVCRLMMTKDGVTRPVYGTKTCFTGSTFFCPPCGPCEVNIDLED